jgi:bifunctional non-homologous end joining protein LigD
VTATARRARPPARTATRARRPAAAGRSRRLVLPRDTDDVTLRFGGHELRLTNLRKLFWRDPEITKGDLLQYYADVSRWLLPHIRDRPMVMKRYPDGSEGAFFFMKRTPSPRPDWLALCPVKHSSGNNIDYPLIQDLPSLLWVINLGCIDLNQWYAPCDDVDRPDAINFDLDPVEGTDFARVRETALVVRDGLAELGMPSYAKTTGASGIHVYVPIVRGPTQKAVWTFAKEFAVALAARHPKLIHHRLPRGGSAGRARAPRLQPECLGPHPGERLLGAAAPRAPVSTPLRWSELARGVKIEDFRLDNSAAPPRDGRRPLGAAARAPRPLPPAEPAVTARRSRRAAPGEAAQARGGGSAGRRPRPPHLRREAPLRGDVRAARGHAPAAAPPRAPVRRTEASRLAPAL